MFHFFRFTYWWRRVRLSPHWDRQVERSAGGNQKNEARGCKRMNVSGCFQDVLGESNSLHMLTESDLIFWLKLNNISFSDLTIPFCLCFQAKYEEAILNLVGSHPRIVSFLCGVHPLPCESFLLFTLVAGDLRQKMNSSSEVRISSTLVLLFHSVLIQA